MGKPRILTESKGARWLALLCLAIPMFGSYFFADMFSPLSEVFRSAENVALGWDATDYGLYTGAYSVLCVFGGLIFCGMLLDRWGVRLTGSVFVGLMVAGAALAGFSMSDSFAEGSLASWMGRYFEKPSLALATAGFAVFGLGSEIAGVVVNRAIAKWFKNREMALAMGVQLSLARLGKATALLSVPYLIAYEGGFLSRPMIMTVVWVGMGLLLLSGVVWVVFALMDTRLDRQSEEARRIAAQVAEEQKDDFRWSDVWKVLSNRNFLLISLLCVSFYCCIISFGKFASAVAIPRFGIDFKVAGQMISMIPFCTIVFAPLFGHMVDRWGYGTRFMLVGACLVLLAHLIIAFAPGQPIFGFLGIGILGIGYSLVPAAMWPSVPKIIPEKNLGTAYSLIYWVQNIGMMMVPIWVGRIFDTSGNPVHVEILFIALAVIAIAVALVFLYSSKKHPELGLDKAAQRD